MLVYGCLDTDSLMSDQESKLPVPQFLKILMNNGIPAGKAMLITGKMSESF